MRTELPTSPHIGFFEGFGARRARLIGHAVDALGVAGILATGIIAVLVWWPS